MIANEVTIDVTVGFCTPSGLLEKLGGLQRFNPSILDDMPRSLNKKTNIVCFRTGKWLNNEALESEYCERGLIQADPYSLAFTQLIPSAPTISKVLPLATVWKDERVGWCFMGFFGISRGVVIDHCERREWHPGCWFGGVRP